MAGKIDGGDIKRLVQPGILLRPGAEIAAEAMDKNKTLRLCAKILRIDPAGHFIFFHLEILQHQSHPFRSKRYHKSKFLCNGRFVAMRNYIDRMRGKSACI